MRVGSPLESLPGVGQTTEIHSREKLPNFEGSVANGANFRGYKRNRSIGKKRENAKEAKFGGVV